VTLFALKLGTHTLLRRPLLERHASIHAEKQPDSIVTPAESLVPTTNGNNKYINKDENTYDESPYTPLFNYLLVALGRNTMPYFARQQIQPRPFNDNLTAEPVPFPKFIFEQCNKTFH